LFSSLFLSKNQKLVKKWKKEHEKIILLTHKVLAEYSKNNHKKAKKNLISLNNLVIDHVTDENIEFYKLLNDKDRLTNKSKKHIEEFIDTFKNVKMSLMQFLTKYTRKETSLDDDFFTTLNKLAEVLTERIKFEESNLYNILDISKEEEKWAQIKRGI
jgi:hypothetical protein